MRAYWLSSLSGFCLIAMIGCAGSAADPIATSELTAHMPVSTWSEGAHQMTAIPYTLGIDPVGETASIQCDVDSRQLSAQATRFDLDISRFLRGDTLQITRITRTPAGDLALTWRHQHPFRAVDITAPPTASNRADLGYTGRLVVLADGVNSSFFGGDVQLDPTLMQDPDGYTTIGDLTAISGLTNTAFPYQLLADDGRLSRPGQAFVDPRGSYGFGFDGGWTQSKLGVDGLGWTGFDYIHAGQSTTGTMTLRQGALGTGPVRLGLTLLIQWTDPKGVAGTPGYLPPASSDPLTFAYRLPFSAIDCSQVRVPTPFEIGSASVSLAQLTIGVRDWDAQGPEAADPNLRDETDVTLIQPDAAGEPVVEFDPGALGGGISTLNYVALGTGSAGTPLCFAGEVTNTAGITTELYGCLRVTDPEATDGARPTYHFGVDPATLAADPARALPPVTYQIVLVRPRPATNPFPKLYSTVLTLGTTLFDGESWLMNWRPTPTEVPGTRGRLHGCAMVTIPVGSSKGLMVEKGAMNPNGAGDFIMLDLPSGANRTNLTAKGAYLRGLRPSLASEPSVGVPGTKPFIYISTEEATQIFQIADAVTGGFLHRPDNIGLTPPVWFTGGTMRFQDLASPTWNPINHEEYIFSIGGGIVEVGPAVLVDGRIYRQNFDLPSPIAQGIVIPRVDGTEAALWPAFDQVGGIIYYTHIDLTTTPSDPFHIAWVNAGGGTPADLPIPLPVPTTPNHRFLPLHVTVSPNGDAIAFSTIEVDITSFEIFGSADLWEWQPGVPLLVRVTDTPNEWELYPAYQ